MKSIKILCIFSAACLFIIAGNSSKATSPEEKVSYQVFYDNLSPFGKWIKDDSYGYAWIPTNQKGFRPYFSNGYWVMTEYGTTWVSTLPWGWAPFHYGRWTHDDFYGWLWVPGTEWGPAWVVWRSGGDNIGWAPMQPGVRVSASFSPDNYTPADWWIFIPRTALVNPGFNRYYKGPGNNINILRTSSVINNSSVSNGATIVTGPHASEYARSINKQVPLYTIKSIAKPAKTTVVKNEMTLYRPTVANEAANIPAPKSYTRAEHSIGKATAVSSLIGTTKKPATVVKKGKTTKKR